jgi:hypothetical protein
MNKQSKRIVVDVAPEIHKALRLKAVNEEMDLAVIMRGLALAWLDGELEFPEGRGHPDDRPRHLLSIEKNI